MWSKRTGTRELGGWRNASGCQNLALQENDLQVQRLQATVPNEHQRMPEAAVPKTLY